MSLLFSGEIINAIREEICHAQDSVQVITAYCKSSALQEIDSLINPSVGCKRLMLRFRKDDISRGSTDFSTLEFALAKGWDAFIRFDLHAKTYIVDNKRCIVGSANATNRGLGLFSAGNAEMATLVDIGENDIVKVNKLFDDAVRVDARLFQLLKMEKPVVNGNGNSGSKQWSSQIIDMFHPTVSTLFSHELPATDVVPQTGYIDFLDIQAERGNSEIKEAFRWSNAYLWLLDVLVRNGGCLYFGAATQLLHNALVQDPKPYRRDVKIHLGNLLSWISKLDMDEVCIDRPNYSQRILLRNMFEEDRGN